MYHDLNTLSLKLLIVELLLKIQKIYFPPLANSILRKNAGDKKSDKK